MGRRPTMVLLLACLGACDHAAPPMAPATAAPPAAMTPAPAPTTSAADAGLAIAIAREDVDRAAREQTLRVQKQLRDQDRAWQQAREAAQRGNGNERCLDGQKMRRVANGWVQAGTC